MASKKRKRPLPVKLSSEEQRILAWNMTDLMKHSGIAESSALPQLDEPCSSGWGGLSDFMKDNHIPKKKKKKKTMTKTFLKEESFDEIVELKLESDLPDSWHCHIGMLRVQLNSRNSLTSKDKGDNKIPSDLFADMAEVKVSLSLESIIDNEVASNYIFHGNTSQKHHFLLPNALRILSMKGFTSVAPDILQTLEKLQKKGWISLVINSKTSVFDDSWEIKVCVNKCALTKMKFSSQDVRVGVTDKLICKLMGFFFKGICDTEIKGIIYKSNEMEFNFLYETVMKRREESGKRKMENARTFVASNKTNYSCGKDDDIYASKIKVKGSISHKISQEVQNEIESINVECPINHEYKDFVLESELQRDEDHLAKKDKQKSRQPLEVQLLESCVGEGQGSNPKLLCDFQHEHLKPTLRQYQRKAVKWMIEKENKINPKGIKENDLHPLWRRCVTLDKKVIFFNPYNGRLTTEQFTPPLPPPGGILADEMGLGKTVEVLACILSNPKPDPLIQRDHKAVNNVGTQLQQVKSTESLSHSSRTLSNLSEVSGKIPSKKVLSSQSSATSLPVAYTSLQSQSATLPKPCTTPLMQSTPTLQSTMVPLPKISQSQSATLPKPGTTPLVQSTSTLQSTVAHLPTLISQSQSTTLPKPCTTPLVQCATTLQPTMIPLPAVSQSQSTTLPRPCTAPVGQCATTLQPTMIPLPTVSQSQSSTLPKPCTTPLGQCATMVSLPSCTNTTFTKASMLHVTLPTSPCKPSTVSFTTSVFGKVQNVPFLPQPALMTGIFIPSLQPTSISSATVVSTSSQLFVTSLMSSAPPMLAESSTLQLSGHSSTKDMSSVPTSSGSDGLKASIGVFPLERSNSPVELAATQHPCTADSKHPSLSQPTSDSSLFVSRDGLSSERHTSGAINLNFAQHVNRKPNSTLKLCDYENDNIHPVSSALHKNSDQATSLVIKCICGNTKYDFDDGVLLKCDGCSAMSHASCLGYSGTYHQSGIFLCPNCAVNRPPIPSHATLIISPATIAHQWVEEITRHTTPSALRVLVYEGVAKQGFVQPVMLADHDIILTTYATLRADFHHLDIQQGKSLRYQKRYIALPSPLTAVKFWRICLDEAQMVETTTAKAAEMALRLHCVNRWCVTGTPIQKGLEDLYGLLLFLGVFPYCQRIWWNKLLYEPYLRGDKEPMHNALADILWRTSKKNVLDEIQLPGQTEIVVRLNFTPVEEHFYRRQHEECSSSIQLILCRFGCSEIKLSSLDRNTVHRILIPLLRLRQACCHPQVVRGGFLSMQKSTMTMDQILEVLITRAKLECEEAHRQLLFAINGLAGIHTIKEEWAEAVELYRESMRSWMEHEDKFRTDALQKLHTLHNLSDLLSAAHPGCSRTLRDDNFKEEAEELVKQYMAKPNTQVQTALDNLASTERNIEELFRKFQTPWWLQAVDSVESSGLQHELINRVKEELSSVSTENVSILNSFTDMRGLGYTLTAKLDVVESTHSSLVQALIQLRSYPTPERVHATAACCLRSKAQKTNHATRCNFCKVDDIFTEYESRLFGHQGMKGVDDDEDTSTDWHRHGNTGGLRAETETEKVLKTLFAFIKSQRLLPCVYKDARNHLAFMEARRKEFKFLRGAWFALRERVSALDELEMCTTKLRLALPGETINEEEKHVIQRGQVEQQKLKFISDRIIARTELKKKLGQYLYLTNLAKNQKFNREENPDPCPVCTKQLGKEWSVFSCGHCYCCHCVWVLLRQAGIGPRNRDVHVKCPICRLPTLAREISYVCTGKESSYDGIGINVKGSHSTKVEAVVRALLKIKAEDGIAKCLVFSTWHDVLELIGKALRENDINFRHITGGGKRFQSGSNGLNIIEATHVLLVEPALNPAHELQAVGRVHRIGQTRPTFVHRFIINNTVESRMHSLLNGKSKDVVRPGSKDTENSALTIADLTSLLKNESDPNPIGCYPDDQDDIETTTL